MKVMMMKTDENEVVLSVKIGYEIDEEVRIMIDKSTAGIKLCFSACS